METLPKKGKEKTSIGRYSTSSQAGNQTFGGSTYQPKKKPKGKELSEDDKEIN